MTVVLGVGAGLGAGGCGDDERGGVEVEGAGTSTNGATETAPAAGTETNGSTAP